jgi:hypothetical protein
MAAGPADPLAAGQGARGARAGCACRCCCRRSLVRVILLDPACVSCRCSGWCLPADRRPRASRRLWKRNLAGRRSSPGAW